MVKASPFLIAPGTQAINWETFELSGKILKLLLDGFIAEVQMANSVIRGVYWKERPPP